MEARPPRPSGTPDALLALALVVAYVVLSLLGTPRGAQFAVAVGGVVLLVAYEWIVRGRSFPDLGLRVDNLRVSGPPALVATAVFAALIVAWALVRKESLWHPSMAWLLPLYPLWGIAQQVLFQGVLHRGLRERLPAAWAIGVTSAAFGLAHLGYPELIALTLAAGGVWSWLYARRPNTLVLGISHGVCAALAYPLVLGDQPLTCVGG